MNEHYIKGLENCKEEKFEEAITNFNRSLLLNPMHLECLYNRGMAKFRLERYLDAIQDFDEAITLAPNNADVWSQRGVTKHLFGNSEAGLKDLDQAQILEPSNGYRYSSRAFIKAKMGDALGAQEDYKKALAIDPEDAITWNNLGMLEEAMGHKNAAKARFEKADAIADEGKTFEKPDIEQVLKEQKEAEGQKVNLAQKETASAAATLPPLPKIASNQKQTTPTPSQEIGIKEYIQVVKEVFTSKTVFKDFLQFAKGKFFLNNKDRD